MKYFLFAEKGGYNALLFKASDNWIEKLVDKLVDSGYKLSAGGEGHWDRQIDVIGRPALCYEFEHTSEVFNLMEIELNLADFTAKQFKI